MIKEERINSIDKGPIRLELAKSIANELVNEEIIDADSLYLNEILAYVSDFLSVRFTLKELLELECTDIACKVFRDMTYDFVRHLYPNATDEEVENYLSFFENVNDLAELYRLVKIEWDDTQDNLIAYVDENNDEEEDNYSPKTYTFHTNVAFRITCEFHDDTDWVENELRKRIGKGARYKWRAADLVAFCCVYVGDHYEGMLTLAIKGNDTYTEDTIATAIHNRLGANAKRKAWDEFEVTDIETEEV